MKTLYTAHVSVTGGRDGRATTADGALDLPLAMPRALGGSGSGVNPEQLFASGFAACFTSSIRHAAKQRGLDAGDVRVEATVHLTLADDGRFGLAVSLTPTVPGLDGADRDAVLAEAERICAYSNATRGQVGLTIAA